MSYDLMVFDPEAAPASRDAFMAWYHKQTQWKEEHGYNDPSVTAPKLRLWFDEMIQTFPPMNGPFRSADVDNPKVTDYSVGRSVIYAAFAWSEAKTARPAMRRLAQKHGVGFFDVSTDNGEILMPTKKPWWKLW
jgi:hypothetical protein